MKAAPLVFLAHASEDKPVVRVLRERLLRAGARPWLDEVDLLPGQDWPTEISRAMSESDFVIACISRHSVGKHGYVQRELRTALTLQADKRPGAIFLIPLVLDGAQPPDLRIPEFGVSLRNIQWLDWSAASAFEALLQAIGLAASHSGTAAPTIEIRSDDIRTWAREIPCPACEGGVMRLNHDTADYVCAKCDHWQ